MLQIPADSTAQVSQAAQELLWWPEIHSTVSIIALVLGFLILIIAYFAGARDNRSKIVFSVVSAFLIGVLSMPMFIKMARFLGILSEPWGQVTILVLVMFFVALIASHAYEIVTVSAREARPPE